MRGACRRHSTSARAALIAAAQMLEDGKFEAARRERYAGWNQPGRRRCWRRAHARRDRGARAPRGSTRSRHRAGRSGWKTSSTATSEGGRHEDDQGAGDFSGAVRGRRGAVQHLGRHLQVGGGLGYKGVQIPSWDARLIDLEKAAESRRPIATSCKGVAQRRTASRSPSCRRICRDSSSRCIRPMTRPSTASRRRRCAASRRRGRNGRSSR